MRRRIFSASAATKNSGAGQANALLGRLSGLRFGTEDEVCWTGVAERMADGYRQQQERNGRGKARSKVRAGRLPFSVSTATSCLIAPLHHSITPRLHYPRD